MAIQAQVAICTICGLCQDLWDFFNCTAILSPQVPQNVQKCWKDTPSGAPLGSTDHWSQPTGHGVIVHSKIIRIDSSMGGYF